MAPGPSENRRAAPSVTCHQLAAPTLLRVASVLPPRASPDTSCTPSSRPRPAPDNAGSVAAACASSASRLLGRSARPNRSGTGTCPAMARRSLCTSRAASHATRPPRPAAPGRAPARLKVHFRPSPTRPFRPSSRLPRPSSSPVGSRPRQSSRPCPLPSSNACRPARAPGNRGPRA